MINLVARSDFNFQLINDASHFNWIRRFPAFPVYFTVTSHHHQLLGLSLVFNRSKVRTADRQLIEKTRKRCYPSAPDYT